MSSKIIFITGASSGIGFETAKLLAQSGHTVYGLSRRVERMQALTEYGVKTLPLDVTDDASMVATVQEILRAEGRIDVLVNNAGYGSYGALEDVAISEAREQFEVNIFGLARLTQLVLPTMRAQKSGTIVNISSIAGKFWEPHGAWYHATKYAVEGLSDSLRMELKQFNIDVVIIEPGLIMSEWASIAREKLLATSGSGAYKDLALKHANMLFSSSKNNTSSPPSLIAKTIQKAIHAKCPKTRYTAGKGAALLLVRRLFSDRMFDRLVLSFYK